MAYFSNDTGGYPIDFVMEFYRKELPKPSKRCYR